MERESGSRRGPPSLLRLRRETLRQAASWGKRGWSLAEKTSPCWLFPRRRHRCCSPHGVAGLVPVTSIPPLPLCPPGCSPSTEPTQGPAVPMPKSAGLGGGGCQDGVGVSSSASSSSQTCSEHHLRFILLKSARGGRRGLCHISSLIPAASQDEWPWPCAASPAYRIPSSDTLTGAASSSVPDASGQFLLFLLCLENQMAPRLVFSCGRADT